MFERITRLAATLTYTVAAGAACGALGGCGLLFTAHAKQAQSTLAPTNGSGVMGHVDFLELPDGVQVTYAIAGLPPNTDHGFHVHERGDCSGPGALGVLGSFDPPGAPPIYSARGQVQRVGDLPNIHADANGTANGFIIAPEMALDGVRSVVGRAIVVERDPDDQFTRPDGNTSPHLACGVIRR